MPADLKVVDSLDMFGAAYTLADQVEEAAASARAVTGLPVAAGISAVIVMGMGGSGMGGDVTAAVAAPSCPVPVLVSKNYECPAWVGPDTLVLASSFSGNTEETIAAAGAAASRGARMMVLASGGELARLSGDWGAALVELDPTIPMPRAGIGAVSVVPLVLLGRLGLLEGVDAQITSTVAQLRRRVDAWEGRRSEPAALARRIGRTVPLIYGGGQLGEVMAWRWKGQFNENVKTPAFLNRVPELTHNEIAGWGLNGDLTRQVFSMIMLRHDYENRQVQRRFELIQEICTEVVSEIVTVQAAGDSPLAQFMDVTLMGDLMTLHLAVDQGVDPGPIAILDDIKARLRN